MRPGEDRREAVIHLHYGLLAEILTELARSLTLRDPLDDEHRPELSEAAKQLAASVPPHLRTARIPDLPKDGAWSPATAKIRCWRDSPAERDGFEVRSSRDGAA